MTPQSDRALPWQIAGRDVRPDALFLSLNTVTSSSAFVLMVGGLALRAAFTALAELDAAIRDAEV